MCMNMLPLQSTPRVRRCPSDVGKGIYQQYVLPLPLFVHVGVANLVILEYKKVSSASTMLTVSECTRISSISQTTMGQDAKVDAARSNGRHQPVADAVELEKTSMTESREHLAFALSSSGTKTADSRQGLNVENGVSQLVDSESFTPSDDTTKRCSPLTILTRVTALVILAIIMVGLFSLPLTLFVVKTTNSDSVSGT